MQDEIQIVISNGEVRFIHDDDLASAFSSLGAVNTQRASMVEPYGSGWTADLSPVGGPVLGPFTRRDIALAAEVKWLQERNSPKPVL